MKPAKTRKTPAARKKTAAPRKPRARIATVKSAPVPSRLVAEIVQALDAKKAEDIRVLQVKELSSITDFLVIATATSDPHQRALRVELEKVLDAAKARILGTDTSKGSGWTVVDAFEVMVHLFTPDNRTKYRLDTLWGDAVDVPLAGLLAK